MHTGNVSTWSSVAPYNLRVKCSCQFAASRCRQELWMIMIQQVESDQRELDAFHEGPAEPRIQRDIVADIRRRQSADHSQPSIPFQVMRQLQDRKSVV